MYKKINSKKRKKMFNPNTPQISYKKNFVGVVLLSVDYIRDM